MKIRKSTENDLKDILGLFNSSDNLTGDNNLRYREYHIEEYINGKIFDCFVYEEDNEIIGVLLIIIFRKARYLYLENIIVKEKFRKRGIALELMKFMEDLAYKNNIGLIYYYSEENNKEMINLSEKLKFTQSKKWTFFWKDLE